jgi:hypothetical protein
MKITHITGETVDTDALPDTEAMVLEKVEEFRQFCSDNKVPFLMFIDPKGLESDSIAFWNFASRANNYQGNEQKLVNFLPMWKSIDNFVYHTSKGELRVVQVPKKPLDDR